MVISSLDKRKSAHALILPFFEGKEPAFSDTALLKLLQSPLASGDFLGKKEELLLHYVDGPFEKKILLLGLGKKESLTVEGLRLAFAKATSYLKGKGAELNITLPQGSSLEAEEVAAGVVEGVLLTADPYPLPSDRSPSSSPSKKFEKFSFIGDLSPEHLQKLGLVCEHVFLARSLVMGNADLVTPSYLANTAKGFAKEYPSLTVTTFNRKQIEAMGMGLLAAVARAAFEEPAFITIEYKGAPSSKDCIALVGKGITFDTGGLNLKPGNSMVTMRDDMAGAAAVFATLRLAAALKLPLNIVGVVPSTENAIGSKGFKPGDIYQSHAKLSVEIFDTDAEGRLVLADAFSYAQKTFKPSILIDLATLTGGAIVALGEEVTALMSNDDALAEALFLAGEKTFERLWRLPLYPEYASILKSKIADIKNAGTRKASSIQGGMFLQRFIDAPCRWAHLDIAGTAFPDELKAYHPIQATGVGVRLLLAFLEQMAQANLPNPKNVDTKNRRSKKR